MKAIILAAGHGTRLRPLTNKQPKCLLPIAGRPLLQIWLETCERIGVEDILVNAHAHAHAVQEYVDQYRGKARVRVFHEPQLLGSAGTLQANRDWLSTERLFWVLYGDVLTSADVSPMLALHHRSSGLAATLGLYHVANPSHCGIVTLDDSSVICNFTEKPARPTSDLAFSGIMIASPELLDAIPQKSPCDIGFDVLPKLVNRMSGYVLSGYIKDIGTLAAYESAQHEWSDS